MKPANHFPLELPELVSEPPVKFPLSKGAIGLCVDGKTKKNLTQSRRRPIAPFSYVGQGREGARVKRR